MQCYNAYVNLLTCPFPAAVSGLAPAAYPVAPEPMKAHEWCFPARMRAPDWPFSVLCFPTDFPCAQCAALDIVAPTVENILDIACYFQFALLKLISHLISFLFF